MKRKFITTAITAVLGVSLLSACGANYKFSFSDYWKKTVNQDIIQTVSEVCEYKVSFTPKSNGSYSVNYQNGTYKTTFISETLNDKTLYYYSTELSIQVQYSVGKQTTAWMDDSMKSTVVFQSCEKTLKPISSEKHTVSHSPIAMSASFPETAFKKYDISVVTKYDENCENATVTKTNNLLSENNVETQTFTISDKEYNYLDNEQLFFATRCISQASNTSNRVQVYSPFTKSTQKIDVNFGTVATKEFPLTINGTSSTQQISYYPTTVKLHTKDPNSGSDKTLWIAEAKDVQNNTYRNAILRLEIPVSFNLGTLIYELKSATFV